MKRILVTGATGFIGEHVLTALHARGFEIHAVGYTSALKSCATFHTLDLLDTKRTREVVSALRITHLMHLAWYAEPGQYWHSPKNLDWIAASLNLLRVFAESGGRRAIVAGTCAEYRWGSQQFHEINTPCEPGTLYGTSKDALRRVLVSFSDVASIDLAWGRLFYIYGPGEKCGRLVSDCICHLLQNREFLTSGGFQLRDFIYVKDVAGALAALTESDVVGAVNIGSGTAISVRAMVEHIGRETGNADQIAFGARPLAESEPLIIRADVTRLSQEVGYVPKYCLTRGIAETVAWWRSQLI
jgi:nucleoside-diphosphate-sugar epimerase